MVIKVAMSSIRLECIYRLKAVKLSSATVVFHKPSLFTTPIHVVLEEVELDPCIIEIGIEIFSGMKMLHKLFESQYGDWV